MKRLLLVIGIALGAPAVARPTCAPLPQIWDEVNRSAAVFAGQILARRDSVVVDTIDFGQRRVLGETNWGTILQVKVLRSWKGIRADSVVTVVTRTDGGSIPRGFDVGERDLIYAVMIDTSWARPGGWYAGWAGRALLTGNCTRTRALWEAAADLRYLGLVPEDSNWLRGSAPDRGGWTEIVPLADSLARLRTKARHPR